MKNVPVLNFNINNNAQALLTFENLSHEFLWNHIINKNYDYVKGAVIYWYNLLINTINNNKNYDDIYEYCDCVECIHGSRDKGMLLGYDTILTDLRSYKNKNNNTLHISGRFNTMLVDWGINSDGRIKVDFVPINGEFRMYHKTIIHHNNKK